MILPKKINTIKNKNMSDELGKEKGTDQTPRGKFVSAISRKGDQVIDARVARIIKGAKGSQEDLVRKLDKECDDLTDKLETMLDQSPDNRYSLKPGKNFESVKFVDEYHATSLELANKMIELQIAKTNLTDLFGE